MMDQKYRVRVNRDALVRGDKNVDRKKRWILWGSIAGALLLVVIIVLVTLGGRDPKTEEPGAVQLTLVIERGDVQAKQPDDQSFRDAADGMTLEPGSEIRTDSEALASLELSSGSVMRLNEDSRLALTQASEQEFTAELTEGEVWVLVAGDTKPHTSVTTEELTVEAQSTTFDLERAGDESTVRAVEDTSVVTGHEEQDGTVAELGKLFLKEDEQTAIRSGRVPESDDEFDTEDIPSDIIESFWFRWNLEKDQEHLAALAGRSDTEGPALTISSPKNGDETDEETIDVNGTTDLSASVTVNGEDVKNDLGEFSAEVDLQEGENTITVIATDPAGNETETKLTVLRSAAGPDAPSVSLSTVDAGVVYVSWGKSDIEDFGSYIVKRDEEVLDRITDQEDTEFTDSAVAAGETYTYNVCVVDQDGKEACSQDESATVKGNPNNGPSVSITSPADGTSFGGGSPVSFGASGTDPDGDSLTYTWDFGDGVSTTGQNPTHTYSVTSESVTFTVRVTVSDRAGASASSEILITITP